VDEIIKLAQQIEIGNLIVWAAMLWLMYSRLQNQMKTGFDKCHADSKELRADMHDIDRRLCRLEGAFQAKECCMIKDSRQMEKAE